MTAAPEILLAVRGLSVSYGEQVALAGVDVEIRRSETLAVVGESGSGKSTLALAVLGLLPPAARAIRGEIAVRGRAFDAGRPQAWADLRGTAFGFVGQDTQAAFDPLLPIGRQIAEPLIARGMGAAAAHARARELLAEVGLPAERDLYASLPERLSGGERQRASIAAALATDPSVLVADEPTSALDPATGDALIELLASLSRARGLALLWISHDLRSVAARADRIAVIQAGRIVETGAAREVLGAPRHAHTKELVASLPRTVAPEPGEEARKPVLRVSSLSVTPRRGGSFEARRAAGFALADVAFELRPGDITALIGASGSGKSTLLRALLALEPGASGSVLLAQDGSPCDLLGARAGELARARRAMGWIPQDPGAALDPRATVQESVAELVRDWRPRPPDDPLAAALRLLQDCGLDPELGSRLPHELSGGERQRATVARALGQDPRLLLLDEPTSNLDPSVAALVVELIRGLVRRRKLSALWVTHDVALARSFAQRVIVIDGGRIVESGPAATVLANPASEAGRRLVAAAELRA